MSLTCSSRITQVTVHARGALVEREVLLPATLPEGDALDLVVPDISLLADSSSVRAVVRGGTRAVVLARAALTVLDSVPPLPSRAAALRDLEARIDLAQEEHKELSERRAQLLAVKPEPRLRVLGLPAAGGGEGASAAALSRRAELQPDTRIAEALLAGRLLSELTAELDERIARLAAALRTLQIERQAAQVLMNQAGSAEQKAPPASQRILIRLTGGGPVQGLRVSYVVPAARWWPLYTLRLSDGGRRAVLLLEALVAQRSGEDWRGVRLALSTADLLADARLPELTSLRLSRAQPPPRKGYRAPPVGLDLLFAGHDRAFGDAGPPVALFAPPAPESWPAADDEEQDEPTAVRAEPLLERAAQGRAQAEESKKEKASVGRGGPPPPSRARAAGPAATMSLAAPMAPGAPPLLGGAPPMMQQMQGAMPAPQRKSSGMAFGGMAMDEGGGGGYGGHDGAPPPPPPATLEPEEGWLDFDALRLCGPGDKARRGRLIRDSSGGRQALRAQAEGEVEALTPPLSVRDPRESRGRFDHRYEAEGLQEVQSDGQAHRLVLQGAEGAPALSFVTVPREAKEVYRQAELQNPIAGPLLAGPVDVYMDGSLLTSTQIERVDRGGTLLIGMGIEERLRVARNARVEEESAGMLGGSTAVTHTVTIELSSALGRPVAVSVIDRVPVSTEKGVEIRRTAARPEPAIYKQEERGAPVSGGLRWVINLAAGERAQVEYQYRVTFPAKAEVVGGNRRE